MMNKTSKMIGSKIALGLTLATLLFYFPSVGTAAEILRGGSSAGDGGKGIICEGGNLELLDLHEIRKTSFARMIPHGAFSGLTLKEAFRSIKGNAQAVHPKLYSRVKSLVEQAELMDIAAIRIGGPLEMTDDAPITVFEDENENSCKIVQLAVTSKQDYRISYIDRDYWDRLDAFDQAFLLIHEVLQLKGAVQPELDAFDSTKRLRRFVGLLSLMLPTADERRELESYW